jgi:hypothetical protein
MYDDLFIEKPSQSLNISLASVSVTCVLPSLQVKARETKLREMYKVMPYPAVWYHF